MNYRKIYVKLLKMKMVLHYLAEFILLDLMTVHLILPFHVKMQAMLHVGLIPMKMVHFHSDLLQKVTIHYW